MFLWSLLAELNVQKALGNFGSASQQLMRQGSTAVFSFLVICSSCGPSYSQCSYCSENGGIIGILLVCKLLHQAYSLQGGSIIAGCDNLESGKFCLVHTQRLRRVTTIMISSPLLEPFTILFHLDFSTSMWKAINGQNILEGRWTNGQP
jgi:hypothetical protein